MLINETTLHGGFVQENYVYKPIGKSKVKQSINYLEKSKLAQKRMIFGMHSYSYGLFSFDLFLTDYT